ncbi:MAG: 4-hydroxybenzoate octaprenyltransferase [Legionellales bacterium]|nr:4-hydroxybenzoate octaprenyltransferase [Legionellales bacterium]|tara:strand:+ start:10105 stop:10965 length:861 start_codon:yes stop_codon:yes gene_type:complete
MSLMQQRLKAYGQLLRFDKPIGIGLLLWPTLWALWVAGQGNPEPSMVLIFIVGVFVMRPAGCVINDICDRNFDKHVARTQSRPLARGDVTVVEALLLFVILSTMGLGLVLLLNLKTLLLAGLALLLSSVYPLMKRYTHLPQIWLGAAWYIGMLMAFTAQLDYIPAQGWLLYGIAILWTVVYDTMYAMVDRPDDRKLGLKSTAVLFAQYDRLVIGVLQSLIIALFVVLGISLHLNFVYYLSLVVAAALFLYQQFLIREREPERCFYGFLNNNYVGIAILVGLLAGWV